VLFTIINWFSGLGKMMIRNDWVLELYTNNSRLGFLIEEILPQHKRKFQNLHTTGEAKQEILEINITALLVICCKDKHSSASPFFSQSYE
jgi:hypothetical protein